MTVFQLSETIFFPPPQLAREDGLLAIGGDLSEERLLLAYQMGIFPWYSEGDPIAWWSPVPRLILEPREFHLSKRLARELRKNTFQFTMDENFIEVMTKCAGKRNGQAEGTWINSDMIEAYHRLHTLGYAHSVECHQDGELVGGLYGVAIGDVFFGESMFSKTPNSSKAAMAVLSKKLKEWNFDFIDCQMKTAHLITLGAKEVSGPTFFNRLQPAILRPNHPKKWSLLT